LTAPSPLVLASASWLKLLSITHAAQAAYLAGDLDEAERLRAEAHGVLDLNLDQRAIVAAGVRDRPRDLTSRGRPSRQALLWGVLSILRGRVDPERGWFALGPFRW